MNKGLINNNLGQVRISSEVIALIEIGRASCRERV